MSQDSIVDPEFLYKGEGDRQVMDLNKTPATANQFPKSLKFVISSFISIKFYFVLLWVI